MRVFHLFTLLVLLISNLIVGQDISTVIYEQKGWNNGFHQLRLSDDSTFNYQISTDYGLSMLYQGTWIVKNDTLHLTVDNNNTKTVSGDLELETPLINDTLLEFIVDKKRIYYISTDYDDLYLKRLK